MNSSAILQNCLRLFIALMLMLPAGSAIAQDKPALQWELVNSFRFIKDRDSMDQLRTVYDGLKEKTARALERKLQSLSDEAVEARRADARKKFDCDHTDSAAELEQCFEPHAGWFETLARNNYAKTCWDAKSKSFRNEGDCANYIYPKSHLVRVWIDKPELLGAAVPEWFIDDKPLSQFEPCAAKHGKSVCVEFPVPYNLQQPATINVTARFSDGTPTLGPLPVKVVDKLIVGLGDSYASGEGNPDIPARFTLQHRDPDFFQKFLSGFPKHIKDVFKQTNAPQKDNNEVSWLDERCHRSMYSYQFQTALRLALTYPQEAITYVSYSCSGAITDDIISREQKSKEGGGHLHPQLESLRDVLANGTGAPREIDYLLLSTGGNDIGFARFVAYVVTTGLAQRLAASGIDEQKVKEHPIKIVNTLMGDANQKGNYFKLRDAFMDKASGIRIKDCGDNQPCAKRILLTAYPDIFSDETAKQCEANRGEFDLPFGEDTDRKERVDQVRKNIFAPLNTLQLNRVSAELGWTVVTDHLAQYSTHGFCAQDTKSTSETAEKFRMPTCSSRAKCKKGEWTSFLPRQYGAYEKRQRWVRLPVDAKLTTDQVHVFLKKFRIDLGAEDDRSNIMHPTSEGLATNADANFAMIEKLEGKPNH